MPPRPARVEIDAVSVVVPARNEERLIARCLRSIADAETRLNADSTSPIPVTVIVVLDRCRDATGTIVRAHQVDALVCDAGVVGVARSAGVDAAMRAVTVPPERHWLVTTDADSAVPRDWLSVHLALAARGAHVVTGLVTPELHHLTPRQQMLWEATTCVHAGHEHVYGANLGMRADVYRAAGGFPALTTGEDQALVDAARSLGATVAATDRGTVLTSARRRGRAPDGFAAWLHHESLATGDSTPSGERH